MTNLLLLLFTGTLIGALYALGKATTGMAPAAILLWQVGGGAVGLALFTLMRRNARPPLSAQHLRYYLISGILGVTAPNALVYFAVHRLDVGIVALITALSTLFTYSGALLTGMERFRGSRLLGCLLGLLGVAILSAPQGNRVIDGVGLLAAVGVPMFLAAANIYRTRAWPGGTPPMALATGMLWLQLPLVAGIAWLSTGAGHPGATAENLPALIAIALIAPLIFAATFSLQKLGGPVYVSQLGYVLTVSSMLLGFLFFGERHGPQVWMAAALVLGGIMLANRRNEPAAAPRPGGVVSGIRAKLAISGIGTSQHPAFDAPTRKEKPCPT